MAMFGLSILIPVACIGLQANSNVKFAAWPTSWRPPGADPKWTLWYGWCRTDSTINIVLGIIIIIIIIICRFHVWSLHCRIVSKHTKTTVNSVVRVCKFKTTLQSYSYSCILSYLTGARRLRRTGFRHPAGPPVPAYCIRRMRSVPCSSDDASETTPGEWEMNSPCRRRRLVTQARIRRRLVRDMGFAVWCAEQSRISLFHRARIISLFQEWSSGEHAWLRCERSKDHRTRAANSFCFSQKSLRYAAGLGAEAWAAPPVPYALPPGCSQSSWEKIICALSTLPIHCRSVKFM